MVGRAGKEEHCSSFLCAQIFGKLFHAWQPRARRIEGFAPCACTCTFHTLETFLHLQLLALGGAFGCAAPAALGCQCTTNRPTFHSPRAEIPNLSPRSFQLLSKQQT